MYSFSATRSMLTHRIRRRGSKLWPAEGIVRRRSGAPAHDCQCGHENVAVMNGPMTSNTTPGTMAVAPGGRPLLKNARYAAKLGVAIPQSTLASSPRTSHIAA